jgi:cyclopropane-fatty-acyl-phospholipid synthase
VDRLLAPGDRFGLQSITMPDHRLQATKSSYPWIHKYIFPGGLIPSIEAIERTLAEHTTMEVVERRSIGPDYAETLRRWRGTFLAREPEVRALGFDETFVRMWDFYLATPRRASPRATSTTSSSGSRAADPRCDANGQR